MLVLSRKTEEKIIINDNIIVTILGVRGGTVKIGIEAPQDVKILRHEMLNRDHCKPGVAS